MPFEAVTTHDVSRARFLLEQVSTALLEADPQMRDDDALFLDMLDGEGADVLDLLRAALRASLDAEAQARACKGRMAQLAERQRRHEARAEALPGRRASSDARPRHPPPARPRVHRIPPRGRASAWRSPNPALLPDPYVRTRREPDKAALLAAAQGRRGHPRRRSSPGATKP